MTDKTPVDLDALDAFVANHAHVAICYDDCDGDRAILDAYPALSAELRRLRGLVREYAEARSEFKALAEARQDACEAIARLLTSERALAAAGKEIAK